MRHEWHFSVTGVVLLLLLVGVCSIGFAEERYTVKEGDSLYGISKRFGMPVETLKKANHLGRDRLRVNQILLIPDRKERQQVTASKRIALSSSSKKAGRPVEEKKKANHPTNTSPNIAQGPNLPKVKIEGIVEEGIEEDGDSEGPAAEMNDQDREKEASIAAGKWNNPEERSLFVRVVKTFLGVPYRLGGATLKGIDCSAFVKRTYEIFSIDLPRTAYEQLHFGRGVGKSELEEGDLVFFRTRRANGTHVGIYIGNNQFVHASSAKREVKVDNLDEPYYNKRFLRGVRVKEFEKEI